MALQWLAVYQVLGNSKAFKKASQVVAALGDMLKAIYDPANIAEQLIGVSDARLSDARTPLAHNHVSGEITDFDTAVSANADVTANSAKVGITAAQAADIVTNNAKVSDINHVAALLPNVDNTADVDKPVSTAQQAALDLKENSLANPSVDGYVLSSTIAGVRSWVAQLSGGSIGNLVSITSALTILVNRQLHIVENFTISTGGDLIVEGEMVIT